jgi:hypothetical protein
MTRAKDDPTLVLLHDDGTRWQEIRRLLPDSGRSVEVQFESPGLVARGWAVALLRTRLSITRIGTKGAAWVRFDAEHHVQFWLPEDLEIEKGFPFEVEVGVP